VKADGDCYDYDDWCFQYHLPQLSTYEYGSDAYASAWASAMTLCYAAAMTRAGSKATVFAQGNLEVTRKGNAGAVNEIDLSAGFSQGTEAWTIAQHLAEAESETEAGAYVSTSLDALCEWLYSYYGYAYYMCGDGSGWGGSSGRAEATSFTQGFGSSYAGAGVAAGSHVNILCKNLQEFSASVGAGMNSFIEVEASSVAHAFSETVVSAYGGAYSEICVKAVHAYVENWCQTYYSNESYDYCISISSSASWCDSGSAYANADVEAFALAYGQTYAHATAGVDVFLAATAHFVRTPGQTSDVDDFGGDDITFYGDGSSSNAFAFAQCYAYADAFSLRH